MVQRDDVIMFAGGSSSAVAIAQQGVAQREKVMFTCCLTHSNDTTGKDCVRYSFREMFNAYMTGQALTPVVTEEYGDDLDFYQLYADYSWGQTQQESMKMFFEEAGWSQIDSVATPLDTDDFSSYLSEAQSSGADVLFLNHYGLDGANSLNQAVDAGIDQDMEIVMPLYNRPMAEAASSAIEGIYGTIAWDSQIDNEPSNQFTEVFGEEYDGRVPSGPAQLAYSGTLQYAAAVERAGTFYPPEVIRQLGASSTTTSEWARRRCAPATTSPSAPSPSSRATRVRTGRRPVLQHRQRHGPLPGRLRLRRGAGRRVRTRRLRRRVNCRRSAGHLH